MAGSSLTAGFIDLATFDEIDKYGYGGKQAFAYFVYETRKSTWFTQLPTVLSRVSGGTPDFGQEWSVQISRAGDYLLNTWLRVTVPAVTLLNVAANTTPPSRLSWSPNLMHNLIAEASISFNDLIAEKFDSYFLDFWAEFTVPASKRLGYDNMIGNIDALTSLQDVNVTIPARDLNLPLPFFFSRDSGVALPTGALPYNDMKINFRFRSWQDLLVWSKATPLGDANDILVPVVGAAAQLATAPVLTNVQVWAHYAIVSNEERKRMACAPRDILIEQVQVAPRMTFAPLTNPNPRYDIRFSHSVKVLFFGVRNTSEPNIRSNYSAASPVLTTTTAAYVAATAVDPIATTSLVYENTNRLNDMGSDYFALVNPWYFAPTVTGTTGYHCYSYSLRFFELDPMGSTNYGKLTNVTIAPVASTGAVNGATGTGVVVPPAAATGINVAQTYEMVVIAVNNNIIRISGGALGFPVL